MRKQDRIRQQRDEREQPPGRTPEPRARGEEERVTGRHSEERDTPMRRPGKLPLPE